MYISINLLQYVSILLCAVFGAQWLRATCTAAVYSVPDATSDEDYLYAAATLLHDDDYENDLSGYDNNTVDIAGDFNWDVLIFTQQWPVTTCYHWREHDKSQECILPQKKEFWTIHGIWPTKLGHEGPNFCNKTADFEVDQLQKIIDSLEQFWPDLKGEHSQVNELWKHEWLKHGTCAALLALLDNELKYFDQGLTWRNKFQISNILDASDIHPDSTYTVTALNNALISAIGKNPSIHCLYDDKKDVSYLAEIRLCFNKTLELIDCDGVKWSDTVSIKYPAGTVNTNCHIGKAVHYPSLVPPVQRNREQKWKFPVVNTYKLLQFIMWFTF